MKKKVLKVSSALFALLLAACLILPGMFGLGTESAGSLKRVAVVFNGDSQTARGFSWYTEEAGDSAVRLGKRSNLSDAVLYLGEAGKKFRGDYVHKVLAEGLEPGTRYYYQVGSVGAGSWSETGSFVTAPAAGSGFTFLSVTDTQSGNLTDYERAAAVLDQAFAEFPETAFVTHQGDFVDSCTDEQWDWYFQAFQRTHLRTTFAPAAGNYENSFTWLQGWFHSQFNLSDQSGGSTITGIYYSFDYENAHFAVLNTNDLYPMSQQQINWLKNDMNRSAADWKIVLLHRSLYSAGNHSNGADAILLRNRLLPVLEELHVDLVLGGHDHMYLRTKPTRGGAAEADLTYTPEGDLLDPQGIVHVINNAAGPKQYAVNNSAPEEVLACAALCLQPGLPVFSAIRIEGDTLRYSAYTVDADNGSQLTEMDTFGIRKTVRGQATPDYVDLPTGAAENMLTNFLNMLYHLARLAAEYIGMAPKLIAKEILDFLV